MTLIDPELRELITMHLKNLLGSVQSAERDFLFMKVLRIRDLIEQLDGKK